MIAQLYEVLQNPKKYKILRTTLLLNTSKDVPSDCFDIAFYNSGSTLLKINNIPVFPNTSLSFSQNVCLTNDSTLYSVRFVDDFASGNELIIVKTYIVPKENE